jgi:hypothetical protein
MNVNVFSDRARTDATGTIFGLRPQTLKVNRTVAAHFQRVRLQSVSVATLK